MNCNAHVDAVTYTKRRTMRRRTRRLPGRLGSRTLVRDDLWAASSISVYLALSLFFQLYISLCRLAEHCHHDAGLHATLECSRKSCTNDGINAHHTLCIVSHTIPSRRHRRPILACLFVFNLVLQKDKHSIGSAEDHRKQKITLKSRRLLFDR